MNNRKPLPLIAGASICSMLLGFSSRSEAATATNLVTICLSATTTTQASKCTKWQYNVYSPTAYIESYPRVSPGPAVWTDPNYDYRLGSTITPTMGVKVCPTALTPGVTFNSANADPCPNNLLIAASTALPATPTVYVITTTASGIDVTQFVNSTATLVAGSPFVESPLVINYVPPGEVPVVSPRAIALDPSGTYLYAYYDVNGPGLNLYSFQVGSNGALKPVSTLNVDSPTPCAGCPGNVTVMAASAHLLALYAPDYDTIYVFNTHSGAMTLDGPTNIGGAFANFTSSPNPVISIQIDSSEQYMYVNCTSNGGPVADTTFVYSLQYLPNLMYLTTLPIGVGGAQIVP